MIGYIPSPPANGIHLGPFELHFYGLLIAIAVLVAAWVAQHRWARLGGLPATMVPIAFWAVIGGLIGARLYSVATSWQQDTGGDWAQIFQIWNGGLGIWGGVAGGVFAGWLKARRMHIPLPPLLDVVAPALALAQAIGRWGNYFNQELFGLPSKLPWAVRITSQAQLASISPAKYRPPLSAAGTYLPGTFQPTFLYECIWDLVTFGLLLLIERKVKLRRGYLFAAYAALYTFGRFFTEYLRIDPAHRYLGLRLNDWTSIGVFVVAATVLVVWGRPRRVAADHFVGGRPELVGDPLPPEVMAIERARLGLAVAGVGPSLADEPTAESEIAAAGDGTESGPVEVVAANDAEVGAEAAGEAGAGEGSPVGPEKAEAEEVATDGDGLAPTPEEVPAGEVGQPAPEGVVAEESVAAEGETTATADDVAAASVAGDGAATDVQEDEAAASVAGDGMPVEGGTPGSA